MSRQTVHVWLRAYAAHGLAGLVDRSSRPASCPHQMAPPVDARIVELRRANPGWGPHTILHRHERDGSRSSSAPLQDRGGHSYLYRYEPRGDDGFSGNQSAFLATAW